MRLDQRDLLGVSEDDLGSERLDALAERLDPERLGSRSTEERSRLICTPAIRAISAAKNAVAAIGERTSV